MGNTFLQRVKKTSRIESTLFGFLLPVQSLKTIFSHPMLVLLSLLPVALTLALYGYLIIGLQEWSSNHLNNVLSAWGWSSDGWAATLLSLIAKITLLLLGAVTFSFVATLVASPFNDLLAEKTERWASPALPPAPVTNFGGKMRILAIDILKTVAATTATLIAILFSWVPVLNIVAFVVAFLLVTFQYVSYPQTRRGVGVKAGLGFLWRHSYACLGFGAAFSFLFAIPLVSCLALPIAVVGGTLLAARAPGSAEHPPLR